VNRSSYNIKLILKVFRECLPDEYNSASMEMIQVKAAFS